MGKYRWFTVTCVMLAGMIGTGELNAQKVYYIGGMQYTSGSYFFEQNTESFYFFNGLTVNYPKTSLSVNLPFVVQNSPWISYGGSGGIPTGGPQHEMIGGGGHGSGMGNGRRRIDLPDTASFKQAGFGDPMISAAYNLVSTGDGSLSVHLNTSVKIPIADPGHGFGTGAWDLGFGTSVSKRLGTLYFSGSVMYWNFGDMPGLELNNSLSYSIGLGKTFADAPWMILGSYSGMTKIIESFDPPRSAGMGVGYGLNSKTNLNVNANFGLSKASADFVIGGGLQILLK